MHLPYRLREMGSRHVHQRYRGRIPRLICLSIFVIHTTKHLHSGTFVLNRVMFMFRCGGLGNIVKESSQSTPRAGRRLNAPEAFSACSCESSQGQTGAQTGAQTPGHTGPIILLLPLTREVIKFDNSWVLSWYFLKVTTGGSLCDHSNLPLWSMPDSV